MISAVRVSQEAGEKAHATESPSDYEKTMQPPAKMKVNAARVEILAAFFSPKSNIDSLSRKIHVPILI